MTAPLVRTEDGAIKGVDLRRMDLTDIVVPGVIEAMDVEPGDAVLMDGSEVLVLDKRRHGQPGCVYLITRTGGGAEVVRELRTSERVHVISVGAFDRSES